MAKSHPAADLIERHAWKPAKVEVDGVEYDATFFDWYELEDKDSVVVAQGKALPEDQQDDFFGHAHFWTTDFEEYFSGEKHVEIEEGRWLPLAVLGLTSSPDSFAEMNNDGLLALVVADGSVIRYNQDDDDVQTVCASIDELSTQLDIEMDED